MWVMPAILPIASSALTSGGLGSAAAPPAVGPTQGQDLAAFSQALGSNIPEVRAAAVPDIGSLGGQLSSGMQDLSVRLNGWQKAHAASAAPAMPPASPATDASLPLTRAMEDAVAGMQGAYVFAIETTLASRGSTELTKVFNTLLKGQ